MRDFLRVVVTGEVDSGKSTLIGRFLYESGSLSEGALDEIGDICRGLNRDFEFAYLLDALSEERQNRLTMDTTQAFCETKGGDAFIFIDVPGHQELIKNMLCGSSYADVAILVIDVQNPIIDEATQRHAFILQFLGIKQILLALNKMDLVRFSEDIFEDVKKEAVGFLEGTEIQPQYFIPICAKGGDNLLKRSKRIDWYRGPSLLEALNKCNSKKVDNALRFPIQDIYQSNSEKIAVGRIISGRIKKGDAVEILPSNRKSKVKTIRIFDRTKSVAEAPESIGLVLNDTVCLRRGQVICNWSLPRIRVEIRAKIFCICPLKINEKLTLECVTQETTAQIKKICGVWDTARLESKSQDGLLQDKDVAEIVIAAEAPVVTERFEGSNSLGRFVLKKDKEICAVGIIL